MLSFGHYQLNHQVQNSNLFSNAQFQYGQQSSGGQPYSSSGRTNLPLTPPGSPDDDESPLIICDSPQKTPQKQPFPASATGNSGISASQESCNDPSNTSFHYASNAAATTTTFPTSPLDIEGATSLAQLFYSNPISGAPTTRSPSVFSVNGRRARNEKKPIPDVLKDEKYYERRRRNNAAAKKSRDARKNREDEIATRASFLEKENAVLRAQVAALREEARNLQLLLLQKQERQASMGMAAPPTTFPQA